MKKNCPECRKDFNIKYKSNRKTFCSNACSSFYRGNVCDIKKGRTWRHVVIGVLLVTMLFIPCRQVEAKHRNYESFYQKKDCEKKGGIMEYRLFNSRRIDCLTEEEAIEYDFQKKMFECLGQALYYGHVTKKRAVCSLIVSKKDSREYKLLKSLVGKSLVLGRVYEIIE